MHVTTSQLSLHLQVKDIDNPEGVDGLWPLPDTGSYGRFVGLGVKPLHFMALG